MSNKGLVIVLATVITLLSIYYLSFTFVARNIQQNASRYATDQSGVVDLGKKQRYLDSMWNIPVYKVLGTAYTYKEVKDNELSLGLDLQGGMHVTLEVSPADIIRSLANHSKDSAFVNALADAKKLSRERNSSFSELFFRAFKEHNPNVPLATIFANPATRGRINHEDNDSKVISVIDQEIEQAIDRSFTILRNRIDQFGTSQPNIQRLPNTGRIQIEIPGAENPQRVRNLLQGVALLEFFDVVEPASLEPSFQSIIALLSKEQSNQVTRSQSTKNKRNLSTLLGDSNATLQDSTANEARGLDSLKNTGAPDLLSLSVPPGAFSYHAGDTGKINRIFKRHEIKNMLPANIKILWGNKSVDRKNGGAPLMQLYFVDQGRSGKARLTGEVITDAMSTVDERGTPAVSMRMNSAGSRIWEKWTNEASSKTPKGQIAIVLDDKVYSAPVVNGTIPNGNSQIAGNFTFEEAKDLANILKAGSLPAPTTIIEEAIIGPTLGKVAQSQGFISMTCGLVLVIVFMIGYYGKGGLVANTALIFNVFFIIGILAQLDASLTLPGIAGIVLTMGMAVDANVIIYERIREELRRGKLLREAIALGFKRSFWTIFDSNITTFITAAILYLLGEGPVKGFAITLMVGITTTFFTAVYISRVIIEWMTLKKGDQSSLTFKTSLSQFSVSDRNFDFIGKRKIAYMFSSIVIAIGIILIAIQGLNLGVDFTGGRTFVVHYNLPVVATDMKVSLMKSFQGAGTEVKNYGGNNVVKVTTSYLIRDDSQNADETVKSTLIQGLEKFDGKKYAIDHDQKANDKFSIASSSKVGATIADDIKASSVKSAIFSLIAIFFYILIRFRKWGFSTAAIASLAHDALFVLAAFAIARVLGVNFEIDQVFVAAILTVIGYSINDTVIIFDRIREFLGMGTTRNTFRIFNDAINSTLNRTLITSGTTLLVVIALFLFGGEVLRGFSFALLIGIGIGTYSSVFIAAPLVLDLEKINEERLAPATKKEKSKI